MLPLLQWELPSAPEPSSHEQDGTSEKKQHIQNIPPVPWGAGVGMGVLSKNDTEISLTFPILVIVDFTEQTNAIAHNLQIKRELNFHELTTQN